MATEVVYLPPREDSIGGASTRALREGPIWLMMQDTLVLIKMLNYLPNIFRPLQSSLYNDELAPNLAKAPELIIELFLFIFETILLIAIPITLIICPGFVTITASAIAFLLIFLLCWPLHGPDLIHSNTRATEINSPVDGFEDERWIFCNGCMTNRAGLQENVNLISQKFGRDVIGIHNKSFGLVSDLLECLVQRAFSYKTSDVRIAYMSLKPFLMDPAVRKVVLFGHSQGGLIVSLGMILRTLGETPSKFCSKPVMSISRPTLMR